MKLTPEMMEAVFAWIGALVSLFAIIRFLTFLVSQIAARPKPPESRHAREAVAYRMKRFGEDEDMARLAVERRLAGIAQDTIFRVK